VKQTALSFALALALGSGAQAQSNEELKQTVQDLQNRVKTLEQQKQSAPAVSAAGVPVVAPGSTAEDGAPDAGKARVEIFGQVMLDAIYDFKRVDPDWNATLRPSKIPVNCPADPGCGKNGETNFSIRQTKLGFKGFIPTKLGELTTLLDFDLFDSGGGNTHARVLEAWGELGWFGAGQYYSNFMDLDTFPNTIDYWGPSGMVFVRNPQVRVTPINHDGLKVAISLEAPGTAIDTGKVSEVDPALGAGVTARTHYPDVIASVRVDRDWGHAQAAGILRQLAYDTPSNPGADPSGSKTGYGLNLSGVYNTFGKDRVTGALVVGRGIASYMNDGGVDLAPNASLQAEAVQTLGWFAYYDHYWNDKWSTSAGVSQHRQSNTDGQLSDAFKKGSYASVNLLYYPVPDVMMGGEFQWGKRENFSDGFSFSDYRIQFSFRYNFMYKLDPK
jgi:hypothetical protein